MKTASSVTHIFLTSGLVPVPTLYRWSLIRVPSVDLGEPGAESVTALISGELRLAFVPGVSLMRRRTCRGGWERI